MEVSSRGVTSDSNRSKGAKTADPIQPQVSNNKKPLKGKTDYRSTTMPGGRHHQVEVVEENEDEDEDDDEEDKVDDGSATLEEDNIDEEDEEEEEGEDSPKKKGKKRHHKLRQSNQTGSLSRTSESHGRSSLSRESRENSSDYENDEQLDVVDKEQAPGSDRSIQPVKRKKKDTAYTVTELKSVYTRPVLKMIKTSELISLKDYHFMNMLGQGGFGQVWLVRHRKDHHRNLALKKIMISLNGTHMTEQRRLRVMRETQIMEQLQHPNIIKLHAHFIDQETTIIYEEPPPPPPQATVYLQHPMAQGTQMGGDMMIQSSMAMSSMKNCLGLGFKGLQAPTGFGGGQQMMSNIGSTIKNSFQASQMRPIGGVFGAMNGILQATGQQQNPQQQFEQTNSNLNSLAMSSIKPRMGPIGLGSALGQTNMGVALGQTNIGGGAFGQTNMGMQDNNMASMAMSSMKPAFGPKQQQQQQDLNMSQMMQTRGGRGLGATMAKPPIQATGKSKLPRQSEVVKPFAPGCFQTKATLKHINPAYNSKVIQPPPPPSPPVVVPPKIKEIIERWYLCIVMEHAQTGDLLTVIERHKEKQTLFEESTIWALCSQIAHGLHYLHSQHVVHRDMKPQNILITSHNCFKIGDLGISRKLNSKSQFLLESKIGTPLYACPELIRKQPYDYKVDMWALGCVLHYMACLEHPFLLDVATKGHRVNRQSIEYQILHSTSKTLPEPYSNHLRIVIQRLLEKDPTRRLSALELISLLPSDEHDNEIIEIQANLHLPPGEKYPELMSQKSSQANLHQGGQFNRLKQNLESRQARKLDTIEDFSKISEEVIPLSTLPQVDEFFPFNRDTLDAQLLVISQESAELIQAPQYNPFLKPISFIKQDEAIKITEQSKSVIATLKQSIDYNSSPKNTQIQQLKNSFIKARNSSAGQPAQTENQHEQQREIISIPKSVKQVIIIEEIKPSTTDSIAQAQGGRKRSMRAAVSQTVIKKVLNESQFEKNVIEFSLGVKKILDRRTGYQNMSQIGIKSLHDQEQMADDQQRLSSDVKNDIPYHQRIQSDQLQNMRLFQSQIGKKDDEIKSKKKAKVNDKKSDQYVASNTLQKPPKSHTFNMFLPPMTHSDQARAQTVNQQMMNTVGPGQDHFAIKINSEARASKDQLSRLGLGVSKLGGNHSPTVTLDASILAYDKPQPLVILRDILISQAAHTLVQNGSHSTKKLVPLKRDKNQSPTVPQRAAALISKQHNYLLSNQNKPQRLLPKRKLSPVISNQEQKNALTEASPSIIITNHKSNGKDMAIRDEASNSPTREIIKYQGSSAKTPQVVQEEEELLGKDDSMAEHHATIQGFHMRKTQEQFTSPLKPSIKNLSNSSYSVMLTNPFNRHLLTAEPMFNRGDDKGELKYAQSVAPSLPETRHDTRVDTAEPIVTHMQSELFASTTQYFMAARLNKSRLNSNSHNSSQLESVNDKRDSAHNLYFALTGENFKKKAPVVSGITRTSNESKISHHHRRSYSNRDDSSPHEQRVNLKQQQGSMPAHTGGDTFKSQHKMHKGITHHYQIANRGKNHHGTVGKKESKKSARFTVKDLL